MENLPVETLEEVGTLDLDKMLNQGWDIVDTRVDNDENKIRKARFIIKKSVDPT